MTEHLRNDKHDVAGKNTGNSRVHEGEWNGHQSIHSLEAELKERAEVHRQILRESELKGRKGLALQGGLPRG